MNTNNILWSFVGGVLIFYMFDSLFAGVFAVILIQTFSD